jgi:cobalamin-dependent methionine synthase I
VEETAAVDPTAEMEPEAALHWKILHRKKDGIEELIDRAVERNGAVPVLNEVLLPAMKEVGDKFGAGELILPFVLQSAEVMKKAVARLETYLEKAEGQTKGKVVLATVYGDVHDIGKNLVNTILTNNGYTVFDLGKQVPVNTIIEKARRWARRDRALGAAGLDLEADAALRAGAAPARAGVPAAGGRRGDQPELRALRRGGRRRRRARCTRRGCSTARTPSRGWR